MLAAVALLVVIAALLVVIDRQGKRHHDELRAHRVEVAGLCQRLQAPETAVLQHAAEWSDREGPMFTNEFDEDEKALEAMPELVEER